MTLPAVVKPDPSEWQRSASVNSLNRLAPFVAQAVNKALPAFLRGQGTRMIRAMVTECQKTPALMECTQMSLFGGVIQAAQLGLMVGGPLGEAFLIPFRNRKKNVREATLVLGYKGLLQLAHRSGAVRRVTPRVVHQGDFFQVFMGTDQRILHDPVRNNTNPPSDYYVVVETVTGGVDFETATFDEMVRHRDRYAMQKGPDGPWFDMTGGGFDGMSLKTLIRRFAKRLPLSTEFRTAAGLDEMADHDEDQGLGQLAEQALEEAAAEPAPVAEKADDGDPLNDQPIPY